MSGRRGRLAAVLGLVVTIAAVGGGVVAAALLHQLSFESYWLLVLVGLSFTGVGAMVAYRRPHEPMGWLMFAVGGLWLVSVAAGQYAMLDYRVHHGSLPVGWLAVLAVPSWPAAFVALTLAIVLFPNGRAPSARWRWALCTIGGMSAIWFVVTLVAVVPLLIDDSIRIDSNGNIVQLAHRTSFYGLTLALLGLTCATTVIAWLLSQSFSYRRLAGERRAQQKWILAGVMTSFVMILASFAAGNSSVSDFTALGIVAMPLAMGVGILKYRLYEIDRLVSRTLSYAIITALLVGTFAGLVLLSTRMLPLSSEVGVAASTLAAAALFNPLRARVQRAVDRRFNRSRYDAEATVAAFAARLRDAVDLDAVQADLLDAVGGAVQPAHATIWMRRESP
jgi:hypothetical protein